jgi:hypothetical protein
MLWKVFGIFLNMIMIFRFLREVRSFLTVMVISSAPEEHWLKEKTQVGAAPLRSRMQIMREHGRS